MTNAAKPESLLLIIPPVVEMNDGELYLDQDFSNNLRAYLDVFSSVHVMCPLSTSSHTFPSRVHMDSFKAGGRFELSILPTPYREDLYFRHRRTVGRLITMNVRRYEYVLISPHSAFDWSTLAAEICAKCNIPYNMEGDWDLPGTRARMWKDMPFGFSKARKWLWRKIHDRKYYNALRRSDLALLQGGDVFADLAPIAKNPFCVLNVQVTRDDHINASDLREKIVRMNGNHVVNIGYAGRAADIKGPFHWLDVITQLRDNDHVFRATWVGEGEQLESMREIVSSRGLSDVCSLPGKLDRDEMGAFLRDCDIFLFCHLAKESPRCLVEALARGAPIVGFDSPYPRGLTTKGGGVFAPRGDTTELAALVGRLLQDRSELSTLIEKAAESGALLERDIAIRERITLMRQHLKRDVLS